MWEKIKSFFAQLIADGGMRLLKVALTIIIGIIILKLVKKFLRKVFAKTKMDKITQSFLLSILTFLLDAVFVLAVISSFGISVTGIIAAVSAAGLAIGLALQDSLSNVASGILMIFTKPFKEGDWVSVEGAEGVVHSIKILTTQICTGDNKVVSVPNSQIMNNEITNFNGRTTRRVDFKFDVAYESDVEKVRQIILDVFKSNGAIKLDPAPFVQLRSLDASSIGFVARCWVDASDYWTVNDYVIDKVFNEFKRNNVSIPYNQLEVRLREDEVVMPYTKEKLQQRVEKKVTSKPNKSYLLNLDSLIKRKTVKTKKDEKDLSKKERKALKDLEKQKRRIAESELKIYEAQKLLDKNGVVVTKTDDDSPRRNLVLTTRKRTFGIPKQKNKTTGETKTRINSVKGVKIAKNTKVKANHTKTETVDSDTENK